MTDPDSSRPPSTPYSPQLESRSSRSHPAAHKPTPTLERFVRTVRAELTDRILIFGQRHLRRVLAEYVCHYNRQRPHRGRALRPPAPIQPAPTDPTAHIVRRPILGGLINEYRHAAQRLKHAPVLEPLKVGTVLRALSGAGPGGLSTTSCARQVDLPRPTAHRLLASLADEGLVDRDERTNRWHLGLELYPMGTAASTRYDITGHATDILDDLAEQTGESAYLSALRGNETVCLAEVEGSFPLRSHVLREGIRFPLGVASAGLALPAHVPVDRAEAYLTSADLVPTYGRAHSRRAIRERMQTARTLGYAVNPGLVVEGSWGFGAAVFDNAGRPRWALSLTGVESRFPPRRVAQLGWLLLRSAHALSRRTR